MRSAICVNARAAFAAEKLAKVSLFESARMFCDVHHFDGTPFDGDPRNVLRRALERAREREEIQKLAAQLGRPADFQMRREHGRLNSLLDGGPRLQMFYQSRRQRRLLHHYQRAHDLAVLAMVRGWKSRGNQAHDLRLLAGLKAAEVQGQSGHAHDVQHVVRRQISRKPFRAAVENRLAGVAIGAQCFQGHRAGDEDAHAVHDHGNRYRQRDHCQARPRAPEQEPAEQHADAQQRRQRPQPAARLGHEKVVAGQPDHVPVEVYGESAPLEKRRSKARCLELERQRERAEHHVGERHRQGQERGGEPPVHHLVRAPGEHHQRCKGEEHRRPREERVGGERGHVANRHRQREEREPCPPRRTRGRIDATTPGKEERQRCKQQPVPRLGIAPPGLGGVGERLREQHGEGRRRHEKRKPRRCPLGHAQRDRAFVRRRQHQPRRPQSPLRHGRSESRPVMKKRCRVLSRPLSSGVSRSVSVTIRPWKTPSIGRPIQMALKR